MLRAQPNKLVSTLDKEIWKSGFKYIYPIQDFSAQIDYTAWIFVSDQVFCMIY